MSDERGWVTGQLVDKVRAKAPEVELAAVEVVVHDFEGNRINGPAIEGFGWTLDVLSDSDLSGVGPGSYILRATVPGVAGTQQQTFRNRARVEHEAPRAPSPVVPPMMPNVPVGDGAFAALTSSQTQITLAMMQMQQQQAKESRELMLMLPRSTLAMTAPASGLSGRGFGSVFIWFQIM